MSAATENQASTEYYAGLIDAQLSVTLAKNDAVRVTLTSHDARVAEELTAKFLPTRVTIIKRPDKKDLCTALFTAESAQSLLAFAAEHCILKKELAATTLKFMQEAASAQDVRDVAVADSLDDVSLDWASGFFDVRGIVVPPRPATEDTKKRPGSVKLVLPKSEKFIMPVLQKVLHGKVKKSSPCRLVYDSKDAIKNFVETVGDHVRAKKEDLAAVVA